MCIAEILVSTAIASQREGGFSPVYLKKTVSFQLEDIHKIKGYNSIKIEPFFIHNVILV